MVPGSTMASIYFLGELLLVSKGRELLLYDDYEAEGER